MMKRYGTRLEVCLAVLAVVCAASGLVVLLFAARVNAQTPSDIQRQIDRLEKSVDTSTLRNFDMGARLAAVEREVEINRMVIGGLALPVIGQILVSLLLFRRLNGYKAGS